MSTDAPSSAAKQRSSIESSVLTKLDGSSEQKQWKRLQKKLRKRQEKHSASKVFGTMGAKGQIYRWGVATATAEPFDRQTIQLSKFAADLQPTRRRSTRPIDAVQAARVRIEQMAETPLDAVEGFHAVLWASAMPSLCEHLDLATWWDLLGTFEHYHEAILQRHQPALPIHLIVGAELALTLAWRMYDLPTCRRLESSAADALFLWCSYQEDSLPTALLDPLKARLILASLIRCKCLIEKTTRRISPKDLNVIGDSLATWVAAMTRTNGVSAFSSLSPKSVRDDVGRDGLLKAMTQFDVDALNPALEAALGNLSQEVA